MTTPFKREPRYFVFKISDMRKYLSLEKFKLVGSIAEKLNAGRAVEGKVPLDAVVVESDWPEYEQVWQMIEARMSGLEQSKRADCDCKNPSQCWEPCGELGKSAEHVKVHQKEPATEVVTTELARFKRMFHAACEALGEINEALGLDPDDGGAEPILDAIAKLQAAQVQGETLTEDDFFALQHCRQSLEKIESGIVFRSDESHVQDYRAATIKDAKQIASFTLKRVSPVINRLMDSYVESTSPEIPVKQEQGEPVVYQRREIGEGDWQDCTKVQYEYAQERPEMDTQIIASPKPAKQEQGEPVAHETVVEYDADGHSVAVTYERGESAAPTAVPEKGSTT